MTWRPTEGTAREVSPGDRVLVTGAAGGTGRHVVRALLDAGCEVRAVDRLSSTYRTLPEIIAPDEAEWITGDLCELDLDELVRGCRAIIHCAAEVGLSESYEELVETNVILVEELYEAARRAGVRHFVHFSAGAIYEPGRGLRNESARIGATNDYERTKIDSEKVFPPKLSDDATHWTILRPALVYGPHSESMSAGLVTLPPILRNFMRYVPGFTGGTRSNWCHVEDAAAAAMVVLGNRSAYERVFNVGDDTPLGFGEVMTAMTEAYNLDIGPLLPFPSPTVLLAFSPVVDREYVAGTVRTILRQLWKRIATRHELDTPLRPKVDRSVIFYVSEDTVLDSSALKELGWAPKWPSFVEGITETVRWYQDHAWVPRFNTETRVKLQDESPGYGFAFTQTMTGTWTAKDGSPARDVSLTLEAEFPRVVRGDLWGRINGVATFEGLAEDISLEGTLEIKLITARQLTYEFGFEAEGTAHRCFARASFNPLQPLNSMTRPVGRLTNERGEEIGEVELALNLAEQLPAMLLSFRLL